MTKVLVTHSDNWADEFDTDGFIYGDKDFWEAVLAQTESGFDGSYGFGTRTGYHHHLGCNKCRMG